MTPGASGMVTPGAVTGERVPTLLQQHLRHQLGAWPPTSALTVMASPSRLQPGWDGRVRPVAYLETPAGTALSVPPQLQRDLARLSATTSIDELAAVLAAALELDPSRRLIAPDVYRWSTDPAPMEPLGSWLDAADPRVPAWLRPFNGGVLVCLDDDGSYLAGVGIKRHDDYAEEIAVGTEPAARGKGVARRLVVTAARAILARGAVPTYVHQPDNGASAHVADAAGFPDRGWRVGGLWRPAADPTADRAQPA